MADAPKSINIRVMYRIIPAKAFPDTASRYLDYTINATDQSLGEIEAEQK